MEVLHQNYAFRGNISKRNQRIRSLIAITNNANNAFGMYLVSISHRYRNSNRNRNRRVPEPRVFPGDNRICAWKRQSHTSTPLAVHTLSKVQKIRVILRRSENAIRLLQWLSMKKEMTENNIAQLHFILGGSVQREEATVHFWRDQLISLNSWKLCFRENKSLRLLVSKTTSSGIWFSNRWFVSRVRHDYDYVWIPDLQVRNQWLGSRTVNC